MPGHLGPAGRDASRSRLAAGARRQYGGRIRGGRGVKTGLYKIDLPDGDYHIRKLTPIECERLQTYPDNYTAGISNTQRYKCLGNSWTVEVIMHILKNMEV